MSDDFERMYEQTHEHVLRYCLRRASAEDAVDATADVYAVAWRRRTAIPPNPLPWLYGVARKVLSNRRRSARRWVRLLSKSRGDEAVGGPEIQIVVIDEHREIAAAVERLSTRDAELIRLAAWEGLTREQLAVALDISENAVTQRLSRALDHLAREIGVEREPGSRFFERRSA